MCSAYLGDHTGRYPANHNPLLVLNIGLSIISKHIFEGFFDCFRIVLGERNQNSGK